MTNQSNSYAPFEQSKHKKANLNTSRNTSKSHNSWEHQTKLLPVVASLKSLMEGGSGRNHIQEDNSESDCDIHTCTILQNEPHNMNLLHVTSGDDFVFSIGDT
ncbi:hypothetical protein FLA4_12110 [Candidatus Rickettsia kotlanii]|nr:hypothetical protein FLA4_12110 [Candidatus Rickettsia kotlanii]BDU62043.1 hypothetical protein HM2_12110 [Candidatus Rickettsia kotlanii]